MECVYVIDLAGVLSRDPVVSIFHFSFPLVLEESFLPLSPLETLELYGRENDLTVRIDSWVRRYIPSRSICMYVRMYVAMPGA